MPGEEKIKDAAGRVLGSVPSFWSLSKIAERLAELQPLSAQRVLKVDDKYKMPPATYLTWLLREKGLSYMVYTNAVLANDIIAEFESHYNDFAEEAQLLAKLDVSNVAAERSITSLEALLQKSVLSVTALYRYIVAQENSMEYALTDLVIERAIKELTANPWLFFSYGEDAQELMPILWEKL